ncbi:unnamed protein product [Adineta steineri]|uniref:C2H2-type domain-containing protein n=1 Tax=Adineta steineri TaxID=433720 RepID=A0A814TEB0_9BILA|nr:unnamed protein product [Adineta steineri]CAF3595029.1 unnamed protein product [Adineta steineri]
MLSNVDEIYLNESIPSSSSSSIPTHFNMLNSNDYILAYSLIKNSIVQMKRLNNNELVNLAKFNQEKLASHNKNLHIRGPKSIRLTCPICGLITVSMERLQKHINQHGQILHLEAYKFEKKTSSLSCPKCKATFSSVHALRKHQRVHTQDKPFSCDFCGSKFSQWGNLRHHIQRHLGISPYACPYCKKTFIAPCKLEVHIRGHLDERPYICDRCQATFRCNDDLRKHLVIHADYKPFVCWLCTKEFFHASKLRIHMKEKHKLDVVIKKKDVLESGTEYEITINNQQNKEILIDEQITKVLCEPVVSTTENYQLLNEINMNDIETYVLSDNDFQNSSQEYHHSHFDDFKFIDFPVI